MSERNPNRIIGEPATVQACQRDYGTPQERAQRAEDATAQLESAVWHGREAVEAPRGRRS